MTALLRCGHSHRILSRAVCLVLLSIVSLTSMYAQGQPTAEIMVDKTTPDFPLRLSIATNMRKDIAACRVRAAAPTMIANVSVNTDKFTYYPVGEAGFVVACSIDSAMLPTGSNIEIARFLPDSTTRNMVYEVEFLDRNNQPISSDYVPVNPDPTVPLPATCRRGMLDLSTGFDAAGAALSHGQVDNFWTIGCDKSQSYSTIKVDNPWYWPDLGKDKSASYIVAQNTYTGSKDTFAFCRTICTSREVVATLHLIINADDAVTYIKVNGVSYINTLIPNSGFGTTPAVVTIPNVTLLAGPNTISIGVWNAGGSVMGLCLHPGSYIVANNGQPLGLNGSACCNPTATIRGHKVWDKNCNGRKDAGDSYLQGWTITATPVGGGTPITTTSDASGEYQLTVPQGTYSIAESFAGQTGWNASTSAGPFIAQVMAGSSWSFDFLNCKQPTCEELFTESPSDSGCCVGRFAISSGSGVAVTKLSFVATDGVVTGITTSCPVSSSPNLLGGTSSGTVVFTGPCTAPAIEFTAKSTTAHGRVCVTWTATFVQGGATFECSRTICITCVRMPKVCNSPLQVVPSTFDPTNTDWRKFVLSNVKQPVSRISSVDISFIQEPTPIPHYGGGLKVDAAPRTWTVGNSAAYNNVRLQCTGAGTQAHGASAASSVEFNLGVDKTIGYTGVVHLKIGYCDGDTCELDYSWTPPRNNDYGYTIDTATLVANPRLIRLGFTPPDSTRSIRIRLMDSSATVLALTPACGGAEEDCRDLPFQIKSEARASTAVVTVVGRNGDTCPPFTLSVLYSSSMKSEVECPVEVHYFNVRGEELGSANRSIKIVTGVEGGRSAETGGIQIRGIAPNPSLNSSTLRFILPVLTQNLSISIVDIQGVSVASIADGKTLMAGEYTEHINTAALPVGSYLIRISTDTETVTVPLSVLR